MQVVEIPREFAERLFRKMTEDCFDESRCYGDELWNEQSEELQKMASDLERMLFQGLKEKASNAGS